MTDLLDNRTVTCPCCWEPIELVIDLSIDDQCYVEDCSVCCRPIVIRCRVEDGALVELDVAAENA
jgi:hypothetical protein